MTLSLLQERPTTDLPRAVQRVAKLCDGRRSIDAVCAGSALPPSLARLVVERLLELGYVVASGAELSVDDERFFASPIDHLVDDVFED